MLLNLRYFVCQWRWNTRNSCQGYATMSCSKTGFWWALTPCVQKMAETIEIKSTEPNQKYGQLSACQFSRRYSKVRKVSRSTLKTFSSYKRLIDLASYSSFLFYFNIPFAKPRPNFSSYFSYLYSYWDRGDGDAVSRTPIWRTN
jgi:hypothetical protein